MSRNFELLRRAKKSAQLLPPSEVSIEPGEGVWTTPEKPERALSARTMPAQPEWERTLSILKKHWRSSAAFAVLVIVSVAATTFLIKPVYEPVARIEVEPPGAEIFSLQGAGSGSNDAEYLETQAKKLQADELLLTVIRKLNLQQNSEMVGNRVVSAASSQERSNDVVHLTPAENAALGTLGARLKVRRDTASRLIAVSFYSQDPQLPPQVIGTLLAEFVQKNYETRHAAIMQSTEWLSKQLDDLRAKMRDSNKALAEFQRVTGIVDLDENKSTFNQQLTELNQELTRAEGERIQLQSLLNNVRKGSPDSLPQVRSSQVVQNLSQKLAEVRADLSQAQVIYGTNHPNVKKLQRQADELQAQIDAQKQGILSELRTSYGAAQAREQLLAGHIKGATKELGTMAQYNALKKEAQATAELYNALYARVKEAGIAAASKSSNIRIVDEARVLDTPTRPRRMLNLSVGLFAALLGGIMLAFVKEALDKRIHTPEDIRKCIGKSAVSIVPAFAAGNGATRLPTQELDGLIGGTNRQLRVVQTFLLDRPLSPEAEALRALYTSVMFSGGGRPPQVLLIASSLPGEGKTTVATNLAIALAQHHKTCIVDADLRRQGVASAFGIRPEHGLSDVLAGSISAEEVLVPAPDVSNLKILAVGHEPDNPGALICSDKMPELVQALRSAFDFIVLDSPPILLYADGRALSPLADGMIFVGRAGVTPREAMSRSLEMLEEVHGAPMIDIVLNAADFKPAEYGYYGSYGKDKLAG